MRYIGFNGRDSKSKIEIKGDLILKLITFYVEFIEFKKLKDATVPDDITDEEIHQMRRDILAKYTEAGINNVREITAEVDKKYYQD